MRVMLTFEFAETGDSHPGVVLSPDDLLLLPNVGDAVAVEGYRGKVSLRTVVRRTFSFLDETRIVMLTCQ